LHIELILAGLLLLAFCLDRWFAQKRSRESLFAAYIADGSFANHPVPVLVYDWDSLVIVDANAAAHHQYGYDDGALMGRKILSLRRSCDVEAFHQKRGQLQSTPGASGLAGSGFMCPPTALKST
jgi:PAS domain-containing protein